jgi:hypothetical protein
MKYICFLCILIFATSCWAPRCPIRSCMVRVEHRHGELSGTFGGKILIPNKMHYPWDKQKGEKNPNAKAFEKDKQKRKIRKRFPWEKW